MNRLVVALLLALLAFAAPAQAAPRVAALTPFSASTITRLGVRPVVIGQTLGALLMGLLFACAPPLVAARAGLELASVFAIIAGLVSALEMPILSRRVRVQTRAQEGRNA